MNDIICYDSNYLGLVKEEGVTFNLGHKEFDLLNNWIENISFILEIDKRLTKLIKNNDLSTDDILSYISVLSEKIEQTLNPTLSAIILVKNEERCIKRCIDSIVNSVDEIIIVDTGSTDNTLDIIKEIDNEKIIIHCICWIDDFSHARNFAKSKASKDWLMFIDADEYLEAIDNNEIKRKLRILQAMSIKDEIVACPFIANHNGYNIKTVRRIFLNHTDINYFGLVHEEPRIDGLLPYYISIDIKFFHDGYMDEVVKSKGKTERNLSLLRRMILLEPSNLRWKFFYYRDGIDNMNLLDAEVGIKSAVLLNQKDGFVLSNIIIDEFSFALLDVLANNLFRQGKFDDAYVIAEIMNDLNPENSNSFYYKCLIEIVRLKWGIKKLLTETIMYREKNISPQYGMIHSEGYHIDLLISILLFENDYIKQAVKYFDFFDELNFNSNILNNYKEKIMLIKLI
ncbi:lipopolysaccharide core biosynthesis glycosyl transferase [Yersinia mollaretii]|uniref:glycosyltransferase family 2 protein n=1 Tax=Yersinia mollaretii TaxID=33060 RepID=UPI0005E809E7|nr:glycosyltransferase family 2 protein [Yersinia mollaretii]CNK82712.1 lipopolysaccharide core biosynthesis glycosyl transferase [Yersinia mollaretii]